MQEKEASFCKSCAQELRLLEPGSSSPGPVIPVQTCLLCCPEKSVFYLGFISFEPLSKLSCPAPTCPETAGAPLFPWLILGAVALPAPAPLPLAARTLLDPREQRQLTTPSSVSGMPHPPLDLFLHLGFRALFCFSPLQKGPEVVYSPVLSRSLCVQQPLPIDSQESSCQTSNVTGAHVGKDMFVCFVSSHLRIFFH